MKVYVSKFPKKCADCKFCTSNYCCNLIHKNVFDYDKTINKQTRYSGCPLKTISDYAKQVRKEVIEEIRYSLLDFSHSYWKAFKQNGKQYMTDDDLSECLDEILGKIGGKE